LNLLLEQLFQTIILGLIQGISEWLPISSTAHLKITEHFFDITVTPLFNLVLHLGTLAVVIFYFRKDVKNILVSLGHWEFKSESGMLIPRIIVAAIPAGIIGVTYDLFLQNSLETLPIIAVTFLIGATIVYSTKYAKEDVGGLSYKTVVLMGIAQGLAVFPGLSRSGVTISTALLLGLNRGKAFKFSFLLSIPAIFGDLAVETYTQRGQLSTGGFDSIEVLAGILVAVAAGYLALKLVNRVVQGKKFYYFAFYTWTLGILLLILTLGLHY
jgi:undecaprenyl-diphosphatase